MSILHTGKDLLRMNELATILLKYGFADVIRRLGLSTPVEHAGKLVRSSMRPDMLRMGTAERLRHAMEEMGPTFVKLGQVLATRVDLFPLDWIAEFEKLQDQASAIPFEELAPLVEEALGKPIDSLFARVDPTPIGVASIGQVHSALTRRGQKVVFANIYGTDQRIRLEFIPAAPGLDHNRFLFPLCFRFKRRPRRRQCG